MQPAEGVPVLEIGGTHVSVAAVNPNDWSLRRSHRWPLLGDGSAAELMAELVAAADFLEVPAGRCWGVAIPGPFDYDRGVALYEGVGKFDALNGVDVGAALTTGLRNRPDGFVFLNDASAFLLGEWLVGAARGRSRVVGITLGTGIGSAFLKDGQLIESGPDVPAYAEVHLLSHDGRPLEDVVSRRAVRSKYAELGGAAEFDVLEIAAAAREGEPIALAVLQTAFTALGQVLAPWVTRFGAEALVVGGSMTGSWDLIAPWMSAGLRDSACRAELLLAIGGSNVGLAGAAYPVVARGCR